MAEHSPRCEKCIYYGRSTMTCDYILIAGHRRPCPPGDDCTARTTRKDKILRKVKWDTELGKLLWLEGKSDGEIADEVRVATSTITSYRKRHWELELIRKEDAPSAGGGAGEEVAAPEETIIQEEENTVPECKNENGGKSLEVYDVLEAATSNLKGIQAICTADAIMCLWNWECKEDLLKAKSGIEYLLRRLEG